MYRNKLNYSLSMSSNQSWRSLFSVSVLLHTVAVDGLDSETKNKTSEISIPIKHAPNLTKAGKCALSGICL